MVTLAALTQEGYQHYNPHEEGGCIMKVLFGVSVLTALLGAANLEAATIFDGGTYDKTLYAAASNVNCGPDCQVSAARFSLAPGSNVITDVHWWGSYFPSLFTDDFTINIYNFISGNPSTIPVDTFNIGSSATRTYTGDNYTYNNAPIYAYDLVIPSTTLAAGDLYLLSILYNIPSGTSQDWGWSLGGSTGIAYTYTQNEGWHESAPNQFLAFYLTGPSSSVPEPSTMLLVACSLVGLWRARRKFTE
jgi:PEP-CTERM motif